MKKTPEEVIKESDECLVAEAPKDVTETENVDKFCPDKKYSTVVEELNNLKLNLKLNKRKTPSENLGKVLDYLGKVLD